MRFNTFVVVLSAASALATPFKRDVNSIKHKLKAIGAQFNVSSTFVDAFPNSGSSSLLTRAFHNSFDFVSVFEDGATSDIQAIDGKLSHDDGVAVVQSFMKLEDPIAHALKAIVEKKPVFDNDNCEHEKSYNICNASLRTHSRVASFNKDVVLDNLKKVNTGFPRLANAFDDKVPLDVGSRHAIVDIRDKVASAFETAIAAFK
ncbi:hypothetical protein AAF712_002972 [Marasmius tenuissimus]|uniref:Uncharacterized protein n=1 Tax=Marasmius tenuissimus TaxID=585030 RepID=A0ABR3A995_9AGAR